MGDYDQRIERALSFIEEHYAERIDLARLAAAANCSAYHFSRVFQAFVGSTPMRYLREKRLDKAAELLRGGRRGVLEVAMACGFDSLSSFNAGFKERFDAVPSAFRRGKESKIPQGPRNAPEEPEPAVTYLHPRSLLRRIWDMNVRIESFPERRIAFFRHVGSYLDTAGNWKRLLDWVGERGLFASRPLFIGISNDDPATTEEEACRHDACATLPPGFEERPSEGLHYGAIPGGDYAVYEFYDTIDKLAIAFKSLFREWLPQSGYELEERPVLEINRNDPARDPEGKSRCSLCLPVRKA
jgi:AraC family transcriptional regulator